MSSSPAHQHGIGTLARRTGCSVATIRYYEQIGLLPAAQRRVNGHRSYAEDAVTRLTFIRRCRDFGFTIDEVRELVALSASEERDCREALEITRARLATVRARLAELRALERSLARFADRCDAGCAGGPAARCSILDDVVGEPLRRCCR